MEVTARKNRNQRDQAQRHNGTKKIEADFADAIR
jgi:hypothetical protein